jgi:hypothetical protein
MLTTANTGINPNETGCDDAERDKKCRLETTVYEDEDYSHRFEALSF